MVFADARASHCWPQVGAAWMPQSSQEAVRTPGKHAKSSLAGVFHLATGASVYVGCRKLYPVSAKGSAASVTGF